ncbi:FAD-dependent oxidoreductase [Vulgatibacter sp.]|uniref:FAD-dependent oxidoreductase n=1 Tax=Vulgatibacter sp. TaxID=1971226 RepID=UPI0035684795
MAKKIVVVGGVAAGASAAAKARRDDEHAEIVVLEKGPYVSFANCGLPYFVSGEIEGRDELLLQTPESLRSRMALDVRVHHEAVAVHADRREVEVVDHASGTRQTIGYDELVLAPGARPIVPPLPGVKSTNVHLLRTVPDADALRAALDAGARRAVVIGGGFIGLEAAEGLRHRGLEVTLVEKAPQVLPPVDPEMAAPVADELVRLGIDLRLGVGATRFVTAGDRAIAAELEDGSLIEADLFLLSIGVRPNVELAVAAGCALGPTGAIAVDERMATSVPGIWAAGDAVEMRHLVGDAPVWIALAGPANRQGRVAGANTVGGDLRFRGALGTAIVRVGRLTAASTGLSEKACARGGIECRVTWNRHGHHAGYFPGAQPLTLKLVSDKKTGRLLGAQAVGAEGVDKRIDVVATALHGGLSVADLEDLDLAYAPPFGAARDPIHQAAMTHHNLQKGVLSGLTPSEALERLHALQVVDVRNPGERAGGMLAGAIGIPLTELRERIGELEPAKETLVYCAGGQRSAFAARVLRQRGFAQVHTLVGGWAAYGMFEAARMHAAPRAPAAAAS